MACAIIRGTNIKVIANRRVQWLISVYELTELLLKPPKGSTQVWLP